MLKGLAIPSYRHCLPRYAAHLKSAQASFIFKPAPMPVIRLSVIQTHHSLRGHPRPEYGGLRLPTPPNQSFCNVHSKRGEKGNLRSRQWLFGRWGSLVLSHHHSWWGLSLELRGAASRQSTTCGKSKSLGSHFHGSDGEGSSARKLRSASNQSHWIPVFTGMTAKCLLSTASSRAQRSGHPG